MATVYDKSSLFLAPSGVSNGTVFTQKPAPIYGPELITNGDFATDSGWTKTGNVTIAGGVATFDDSGSNTNTFLQQNVLTTAKKYLITLDIKRYAAGRLQIVAGSDIYLLDISQGVGSYQIQTNAVNSATLRVKRDGSYPNFDFDIDNVSAKEVLVDDADFTFSRGSNLSATRVNADGLIEKGRENIVLHSNDFSQSSWAKLNGASVSSTQVADPFGGTNAWELTFATNTDSRIEQQVTTVNNTVYAFSVWARVTSGTKIVNLGAVGNLQQKTLGTTWQRIQGYAKETDTNGFPQIRKHSAEGEYTIQIYGFQLELGTTATDYIGSAATTGKAGLLENTPRLDYSGGATCPSLLLEPQRTNLVSYSEYLNGSIWMHNSTTATINADVSPSGYNDATSLYISLANPSVFSRAQFTNVANSTHIGSVFLKKVSGSEVRLRLSGSAASIEASAIFNLDNGTYRDAVGSVTPSIELVGNGWYRCSIGDLSGSGIATPAFRIDTLGAQNDTTVLVWGAVVEVGTYPTSYIPTYGTSQTRGADVCNSAGDSSTFNDSEGVLYAEVAALANDGTNRRIVISDGTFNNSVQLYYYPVPNKVRTSVKSGGITSIDATAALSDATNYHKIAIRYKTNDFSLWVDGVKVGTDTSGNAPSGLNQLNFNDAGGSNFYGKAKQILTFNTALSDIDLAILTGATTYETFEEMALALNYTVYE